MGHLDLIPGLGRSPREGKGYPLQYSGLEISMDCIEVKYMFTTVGLEKTLESPLDSKEVKSVNPKGNHCDYSLEGLILNLKLQYFGHIMGRDNSLEKTLML